MNRLDLGTKATSEDSEDEYEFEEGRDRKTGQLKWTATRVDLVFSNEGGISRQIEMPP